MGWRRSHGRRGVSLPLGSLEIRRRRLSLPLEWRSSSTVAAASSPRAVVSCASRPLRQRRPSSSSCRRAWRTSRWAAAAATSASSLARFWSISFSFASESALALLRGVEGLELSLDGLDEGGSVIVCLEACFASAARTSAARVVSVSRAWASSSSRSRLSAFALLCSRREASVLQPVLGGLHSGFGPLQIRVDGIQCGGLPFRDRLHRPVRTRDRGRRA